MLIFLFLLVQAAEDELKIFHFAIDFLDFYNGV